MTRLRSIIVTYDDGTVIPTSMAAHLTDKEMLDYFAVGKPFNIGSGERDHVVCVANAEIVRKKYGEFCCRGNVFIVDESGNMIQREAFEGGCNFSDKWKLLGVTKKWNRNSLDVKFDEI